MVCGIQVWKSETSLILCQSRALCENLNKIYSLTNHAQISDLAKYLGPYKTNLFNTD